MNVKFKFKKSKCAFNFKWYCSPVIELRMLRHIILISENVNIKHITQYVSTKMQSSHYFKNNMVLKAKCNYLYLWYGEYYLKHLNIS